MRTRRASTNGRSGSVLVTAVVVAMILGAMALAFMSVSARSHEEGQAAGGELNAFYAADAGLSAALVGLRNGGDGAVGSQDAPVAFGGLDYWVTASPVDATVTSLVSTGSDGQHESRIEM